MNTKLNKLYDRIYFNYVDGNYKKTILKKKGFDKFFFINKKENINDLQNETEKYICYLWSKEHNIENNDFKHIYEIEDIGDTSFLKRVTFNQLLKFISPQTEII